jgi:hypothetical protein
MLPPDAATCLGCGYALRGLTTWTCPECGREFHPNKPWTMQIPGAPHQRLWRAMEPARWNVRAIRKLVIVLLVLSAWFPVPVPLPLFIFLLVVWVVMSSYRGRATKRQQLISFYNLPPDTTRVDEADVARLRKTLGIAFVLMLLHVPFFTAFAVSYPFLARSANYWWAVAPATQNPPKHWTIRGVFLVKIEAGTRGVAFRLPVGHISFVQREGRELEPKLLSGFIE